jgi:hypothetical protein
MLARHLSAKFPGEILRSGPFFPVQAVLGAMVFSDFLTIPQAWNPAKIRGCTGFCRPGGTGVLAGLKDWQDFSNLLAGNTAAMDSIVVLTDAVFHAFSRSA